MIWIVKKMIEVNWVSLEHLSRKSFMIWNWQSHQHPGKLWGELIDQQHHFTSKSKDLSVTVHSECKVLKTQVGG